jgi:hypothetical protein
MKSKILFLAVLAFFLAKPYYCFSQSETETKDQPTCCHVEDKSNFYHVNNQVDEDKLFTLSFGLTEILGNMFSNKVTSIGLVDENDIERDKIGKINVRAKIGERLEVEEISLIERFLDDDFNKASTFHNNFTMRFTGDDHHDFRIYIEHIEFAVDDERNSIILKTEYQILKNKKQIYHSKSMNKVVSSAKIHKKQEVDHFYELLAEYLEDSGCVVQFHQSESTLSAKSEIVNYVCLCAEIAKFVENVKLIE